VNGDCIYCAEDTGTGKPGSSHVCCRKLDEGVPLAEVILAARDATFAPGGYEEMVRRACRQAIGLARCSFRWPTGRQAALPRNLALG